jgi:RHS repeat-associated protein
VTTLYKRFGQPETITDGTGTRTFHYDGQLRLQDEFLPATFYNGRILTRKYDALGRDAGFKLGVVADLAQDHEVTYGYDSAGRFAGVQDQQTSWAYGFVPQSNLVSGVTSGNRTVSYGYETGRNLVTSIENKVGATTVSQFTYFNNALGQRETRTQGGTAFAATATETFGYNGKGELETSTHSGIPARNTSYGYDGIGNRNTATFGGATTTYTPNTLNQYTAVSSAPQAPTYDPDGNQETDFGSPGALHLVYDGENRLKEVRNASAALLATYTYDGQSRRVKKATTSAAPQGEAEEIYLYDGWNRIATYALQPSSFTLQTSLTWGRDLSGTPKGAGGVGGLLATRDVSAATTEYLTYDANGNVSELLNTSDNPVAHYEYDPFGNAVVATGTSAASNSWRFSTKPVDAETGYSYYGYRFYNPVDGRWINRDPIAEQGGVNLYGFVLNNPENAVDSLGNKGLSVMFAADTSVRDLAKAQREANNATDFLRGKIRECCKKFKIACDVALTSGFSSIRPNVPPSGRYITSDIQPTTESIGGHADFNIVITATRRPNTGQSGQGYGSIIGAGSNPSTGAHEIGHDAGYRSDNPYTGWDPLVPESQSWHDDDQDNLMFPINKGKREVDCKWCSDVTEKAK